MLTIYVLLWWLHCYKYRMNCPKIVKKNFNTTNGQVQTFSKQIKFQNSSRKYLEHKMEY